MCVCGNWLQSEMDTACKSREQLVLAERLFDMDITSYPCLGQLESEMKKLQQVKHLCSLCLLYPKVPALNV